MNKVIHKSGIGQGADLMVHAPEGLPDKIDFDYSVYLAGDMVRKRDLFLPVDLKWQIRYIGGPGSKMLNPGYFRWSMWLWVPTFGAKPIVFDRVNNNPIGYPDCWDSKVIRDDLQTKLNSGPYLDGKERWWIDPMDPSKVLDPTDESPDSIWNFGIIPPRDETPEGFVLSFIEDPTDPYYAMPPNPDVQDLSIIPHPKYCIAWKLEAPQIYDHPVPLMIRERYANAKLYFIDALVDWLMLPQGEQGFGDYSRRCTVTFAEDDLHNGVMNFSEEWYAPGQADRYSWRAKQWYTHHQQPWDHVDHMIGFDLNLDYTSSWRMMEKDGHTVLMNNAVGDDEYSSDPQGFSLSFKLNFDDPECSVVDEKVTLKIVHTPIIETYFAWDIQAFVYDKDNVLLEQIDLEFDTDPSRYGTTYWVFEDLTGADRVEIFFRLDLNSATMIYDYDNPAEQPDGDYQRFFDVAGWYDGVIAENTWIQSFELTSNKAHNDVTIDTTYINLFPVAEQGDALYDEAYIQPKPDYDPIKLMWTYGVITPPPGVVDVWDLIGNPAALGQIGAPGFNWNPDQDASRYEWYSHKRLPTMQKLVLVPTELRLTSYMSSVGELMGPYIDGETWYMPIFPYHDPRQPWPADPMDPSLWYQGPTLNSSRWIERDPAIEVPTGIDRRFVLQESMILMLMHPTEGAICKDDGTVIDVQPLFPDGMNRAQDINLFISQPRAIDGSLLKSYYSRQPEGGNDSGAWIQWDDDAFRISFFANCAYHREVYVAEPWLSQDVLVINGAEVQRDKLYVCDFLLRDLNIQNLITADTTPPEWKDSVVSHTTAWYLHGNPYGGVPDFEISAAPGFISENIAQGREGLTNLRWEVEDNSPFVNSFLIQETTPDPFGNYNWKVKAEMNLNIETLWYPRMNAGYYFFGPQEYYLFAEEATQSINLQDNDKNPASGRRYGNKLLGRDFSHYGIKLAEQPKQSAPIIVVTGYELDGGVMNSGYGVKVTTDNGPEMVIDEHELANSSMVANCQPGDPPPTCVAFSGDRVYTIAKTDQAGKWALCYFKTSSADLPIDDSMKTKLADVNAHNDHYLEEPTQLFINRNYGKYDFELANRLLTFDFTAYPVQDAYQIDAISVAGDTLLVAITFGGGLYRRLYLYSIGDLKKTHIAWNRDTDPYIELGIWFKDQCIRGVYLDGDTIVLSHSNDQISEASAKQILLLDMNTGQILRTISLQGNRITKLRGLTAYGDFYFLLGFVQNAPGHSGWQIIQVDSDGDIVAMHPYPVSGGTDNYPLFLALAGTKLVIRTFAVDYHLVYLNIDTNTPPTLRPVCMKQTWTPWYDRAGISRVEEFDRNKFHLYPLEYGDVVIESIEVINEFVDADGFTDTQTLEILRVEDYHDETRDIEGVGIMKGPFYRVDPNDTISGDNRWLSDFNWYYAFLFDPEFFKEAWSGRLGTPEEDFTFEMNYANMTMIPNVIPAVASVRNDMRLASISLNDNKVYLETPETVSKIRIRYLVKRAFSTFSMNRMMANQIDPNAGLSLNTFLCLAERRLCKAYYERAVDPYYHLAPKQMVDPGADIINLISFNPVLTVENSGFLFIDNIDQEVASIDVELSPSTIIAAGDTISDENIMYWYAIARDKHGTPVPNRPLRVRAFGYIVSEGEVIESELECNIRYANGNMTNFMGKIGGTLTLTGRDIEGHSMLRTKPAVLVVEYSKRGDLSASRDIEVVAGVTEIWIQGAT